MSEVLAYLDAAAAQRSKVVQSKSNPVDQALPERAVAITEEKGPTTQRSASSAKGNISIEVVEHVADSKVTRIPIQIQESSPLPSPTLLPLPPARPQTVAARAPEQKAPPPPSRHEASSGSVGASLSQPTSKVSYDRRTAKSRGQPVESTRGDEPEEKDEDGGSSDEDNGNDWRSQRNTLKAKSSAALPKDVPNDTVHQHIQGIWKPHGVGGFLPSGKVPPAVLSTASSAAQISSQQTSETYAGSVESGYERQSSHFDGDSNGPLVQDTAVVPLESTWTPLVAPTVAVGASPASDDAVVSGSLLQRSAASADRRKGGIMGKLKK
jgi:hypothetical protein